MPQSNEEQKKRNAEYMKSYRERNPEKVKDAKRKSRWQSRHGITEDDYDRMEREQGFRCGICGTTEPRRAGTTRFCVDHDHVSGKIRGLLCNRCNVVLGQIGDNLVAVLDWSRQATEYLR